MNFVCTAARKLADYRIVLHLGHFTAGSARTFIALCIQLNSRPIKISRYPLALSLWTVPPTNHAHLFSTQHQKLLQRFWKAQTKHIKPTGALLRVVHKSFTSSSLDYANNTFANYACSPGWPVGSLSLTPYKYHVTVPGVQNFAGRLIVLIVLIFCFFVLI